MVLNGCQAWHLAPGSDPEGTHLQVIINAITAEKVFVQTTTGPGGRAGPLRVDFSRGTLACLSEYSLQEAQTAFQRMVGKFTGLIES